MAGVSRRTPRRSTRQRVRRRWPDGSAALATAVRPVDFLTFVGFTRCRAAAVQLNPRVEKAVRRARADLLVATTPARGTRDQAERARKRTIPHSATTNGHPSPRPSGSVRHPPSAR